jgi:hypothetical protein
MDSVWSEILVALAAKVPDLVVFLMLVYVFMRAQKNMVREFVGYMASKDEQFEAVLEENTKALNENTKALGAALHVLGEQDG